MSALTAQSIRVYDRHTEDAKSAWNLQLGGLALRARRLFDVPTGVYIPEADSPVSSPRTRPELRIDGGGPSLTSSLFGGGTGGAPSSQQSQQQDAVRDHHVRAAEQYLDSGCEPPQLATLRRAGFQFHVRRGGREGASPISFLRFTSLFESGNLAQAFLAPPDQDDGGARDSAGGGGPTGVGCGGHASSSRHDAMKKSEALLSYDLFLDFDANTEGYTQW